MKENKLIPMVQYILEIDWLTTKEFCEKYNIPLPTLSGGVKDFLRVDAIKHKMYVEYAKFLTQPISVEILQNKLGFTLTEGRGGLPKFKNGKFIIIKDNFGFWLEPYDSVDGIRLSKVENLVGIGIKIL